MGCHLSLVQCQQEGEGWQAVAGALGGAGRGAGGGEPALQYIIYTYIYIYVGEANHIMKSLLEKYNGTSLSLHPSYKWDITHDRPL